MATETNEPGFIVWGLDQSAYGPVDLPTLVSWVKDERVTAETWIYGTQPQSWQRAQALPELQMFFRNKASGAALRQSAAGLKPQNLRRIKILASLSDGQLEKFASYVEVERVPQWSVLVKQGDPGDAMYFILEGELRARMNVMGKETILATFGAGEFFGDIALFDHGPRSADVVANVDSSVVKLRATAFAKIAQESPDLATPVLLAIGRTLTARIRADNKRWGDSVKFAQARDAS